MLEMVARMAAANGQPNGFCGNAGFIPAYQSQVAASSCSGHFPRQNTVQDGILVYIFLYSGLHHGREHSHLCMEGGFIGSSETLQVFGLKWLSSIHPAAVVSAFTCGASICVPSTTEQPSLRGNIGTKHNLSSNQLNTSSSWQDSKRVGQ